MLASLLDPKRRVFGSKRSGFAVLRSNLRSFVEIEGYLCSQSDPVLKDSNLGSRHAVLRRHKQFRVAISDRPKDQAVLGRFDDQSRTGISPLEHPFERIQGQSAVLLGRLRMAFVTLCNQKRSDLLFENLIDGLRTILSVSRFERTEECKE